LLCLASFAPKQRCPIARVYAYSQTVSPGVSPKGPIEEGGNESKSGAGNSKSNYFIYMLSKKKYNFSPTVLWIKGQGFEVKMDTITQLPVKLSNNGKTIQLVPSTSKRVVMLTAGAVMNFFAPPPPELQKLLDTNELVIEYRWNSKACYFSIPKIKVLERVAAE
jgi:hypothetical protein